ncbi:MAG TPA: signal peptidase I [Pyrinomonadaceae bacterium]|nr:signal peptidase I [Pyrinomonadaceae bacterium]HMP65795.1 signal peptidase I [Pyrinomonadaceae bacterium]
MSKEEQETPNESEAQEKPEGPPKSVLREYFESFTVTLVMAIFGMTFILQAVTVPTGSMQNTILVGDYLLVNKFIFSPGGNPLPFLPMRDIERGDIIVFKYPGNRVRPERDRYRGPGNPPLQRYQINYVKRVIALPGETVEFRDNRVYINGELLPEHRVIGEAPNSISALEVTEFEDRDPNAKWTVYYSESTMKAVERGQSVIRDDYEFAVQGRVMTVPPDNFFVLGDARDYSEDSRVWGFVPRELVIGRAMFVYWSCDRGASNGDLFGCITHPRLSRIGKFVK